MRGTRAKGTRVRVRGKSGTSSNSREVKRCSDDIIEGVVMSQ